MAVADEQQTQQNRMGTSGTNTSPGGNMSPGRNTGGTPNLNRRMLTTSRTTPSAPTRQYKIHGTNQFYSGMVVQIGADMFTTKGGAFEGTSQRLETSNPNGGAVPNTDFNPDNRRALVSSGTGTGGNTTPGGPRNNQMNQGGGSSY